MPLYIICISFKSTHLFYLGTIYLLQIVTHYKCFLGRYAMHDVILTQNTEHTQVSLECWIYLRYIFSVCVCVYIIYSYENVKRFCLLCIEHGPSFILPKLWLDTSTSQICSMFYFRNDTVSSCAFVEGCLKIIYQINDLLSQKTSIKKATWIFFSSPTSLLIWYCPQEEGGVGGFRKCKKWVMKEMK